MRIQHNIAAMNSYRNFSINNSSLNKNLEKLSSGYKINRAGDDAAGLAISEKMRAQISGLTQAKANAKDGISLVQTAEGALTEVHDMLNRMYKLAEQAANGTYTEKDRSKLDAEVQQLKDEINRINNTANFNGQGLFVATAGTGGVDTDPELTALQDIADLPVTASASGVNATNLDLVSVTMSFEDAASVEDTNTFLKAAKGSVGITLNVPTSASGSITATLSGDLAKTYDVQLNFEATKTGSFKINGEDVAGSKTGTIVANIVKKDSPDEVVASFKIPLTKAVGSLAAGDTKITFSDLPKSVEEAKTMNKTAGATNIISGKATISGTGAMSAAPSVKFSAAAKASTAAISAFASAVVAASKGGISVTFKVNAGGSKVSITGVAVGTKAFMTGGTVNSSASLTGGYKISVSNGSVAKASIGKTNFTVTVTNSKGSTVGTFTISSATVKASMTANASSTIKIPIAKPKSDSTASTDTTTSKLETVNNAATSSSSSGGAAVAGVSSDDGRGGNSFTFAIGEVASTYSDGAGTYYNLLTVNYGSVDTVSLGIDGVTLKDGDGSTTPGANAATALDKISDAIDMVSTTRGYLGAIQNRLDHTINNLGVMTENIQDAESTIRDTDVAEEMMAYTKNSILNQAAQAMLAQANQQPQGVLQLLG